MPSQAKSPALPFTQSCASVVNSPDGCVGIVTEGGSLGDGLGGGSGGGRSPPPQAVRPSVVNKQTPIELFFMIFAIRFLSVLYASS